MIDLRDFNLNFALCFVFFTMSLVSDGTFERAPTVEHDLADLYLIRDVGSPITSDMHSQSYDFFGLGFLLSTPPGA
jgi:hypothetical protein